MKKFEFSKNVLEVIKNLTNENHHLDARFEIAFVLAETNEGAFGNLCDAYLNLKGLARVQDLFDGNEEIWKIRTKLDKTLRKALEIAVINCDEVWDCL